jgi:hypothetical protein
MTIARPRETHAELESWKTNDLLPETVQREIRQLLLQAIEDMDDLNREISETKIHPMSLQQHLKDLHHEKTEDTARIRTLRSAISPLKKIPPEVLTEIFIHLFPDKMVLPPTKKSHPWTLTHVCTHWRNIVWTSPATSGVIRIEDPNCIGGYDEQMEFIHRWSPIVHATFYHVLSVTRSLLSLHAPRNGAAAIFDLVLSHSYRFQSLALEINKASFGSFMNLPQHSLKYLEDLDIHIYGDDTPVHNTTSSLETLPNLYKVSLTSVTFRNITLSLLLPWEQLKEVTMTHMNIHPTIVHTVLQHCQALRKCRFTMGPDQVLPFNAVITLPHLEILDLTSYYASHHALDWDAFLQPFVTPSLKGLTIATPHTSLQAFIALIIRSKCSLSAMIFDICTDEPTASDYESFLEHLSTVTTFESIWTTPTSIIKKIHKSLLPRLKTSFWTVHPNGLESLLNFINAAIQDSKENTEHSREIKMLIVCRSGPGLGQVEKRYQGCYEQYQDYDWLDLDVHNLKTRHNMEDVHDSEEEGAGN